MPPRRRPRDDTLTDIPSESPPKRVKVEESDLNATIEKPKPTIVDDEISQSMTLSEPTPSIKPTVAPKPSKPALDDSIDDGRPVCAYDADCYRKNPKVRIP